MLGLHAYHVSAKLGRSEDPFYALIAAAMRRADTDNLYRLRNAFPAVWDELQRRYNAPLGVLPEDGIDIADMETLRKSITELYAQ